MRSFTMSAINMAKAAVRGVILKWLCLPALVLGVTATVASADPPGYSGTGVSGTVLGVQAHWDYNAGGYYIDYVDPNGLAAHLPDGTYLERGDVIVAVGGIPAAPNKQLAFLMNTAVNTGSRFILVTDVNSGTNFYHRF